MVDNRYQPKIALRNADHLIRERVDLVIEFQTDEVIAQAARLAAEAAEPKEDARGSAAYKKDVVRVFVQRGLKTAIGRAGEAR